MFFEFRKPPRRGNVRGIAPSCAQCLKGRCFQDKQKRRGNARGISPICSTQVVFVDRLVVIDVVDIYIYIYIYILLSVWVVACGLKMGSWQTIVKECR